jgi:16S rRNA (guanine966-N2)-methyltransferase
MAELRIVAGQWRGRRIQVPPSGVRPTADRVREAWMSILQRQIPDAQVLDLCAGSGALGLECLSRGAAHCDFVEVSPQVAKVLRENITSLGAGNRSTAHIVDAVQFVQALGDDKPKTDGGPRLPLSVIRPYQLALADPPYATDIAKRLAAIWLQRPFADIFGIEHAAAVTLPDAADGSPPDRRRYGDTALTIYRVPA